MAAVLALAPGVAALASAADAAAAARPTSIVIIGVPDLRWSDVNQRDTPSIAALADRGSIGALVDKAPTVTVRAPDGWATLGAGNRGVAAGSPGQPLADRLVAATKRNNALSFAAKPGAFAAALHAAGHTITAVGGAGAELAAADPAGRLDRPPADVTVVEDDRIYASPTTGRAAAARAVDADVRVLITSAHRDTTVFVLGVSDGPASYAHLHVAIAAGPGFARGEQLVSASTARAPYVELIDVAPTVLHLFGATKPSSMVGTAIRSEGGRPSLASLVDLDRKAGARLHWALVVTIVLVSVSLALAILTAACLHYRRAEAIVEPLCYAAAALPLATYCAQLLPWWRLGWPAFATPLAAVMGALCAAATTAASRRRSGGLVVVAGATAIVLALDLLTGANLQQSAMLGDDPLIAGRFTGAGNLCFALFAASTLLVASSGRPRIAAAFGAVALFIDGFPRIGADVGGLLALTPAVVLLVLLRSGARIRWSWLLGALGSGLVLVAGAAAYDYSRPTDRQTDLGRFVGGVLHGGSQGATVHRKALAAANSVPHSPYSLLVLGTVIAAVLARHQLAELARRVPGLGAGLIATAVCLVIGGFVNDSGVAVPGVGAALAVPLCCAVLLRVSRAPSPAVTNSAAANRKRMGQPTPGR